MNDSKRSIMYIEFWRTNTKLSIMKHARNVQKDPGGKYIPVLSENIFKCDQHSTMRGTKIDFFNVLTDDNRKIFAELKKHKSKIHKYWIRRGQVTFQQSKKTDPIGILSLRHLNEIITRIDNNTHQLIEDTQQK